MTRTRVATACASVLFGACVPSTNEYVRLKEVAPAQLAGSWIRFGGWSAPRAMWADWNGSAPPADYTLELRRDGGCVVGSRVTAFVASCNVATQPGPGGGQPCGWTLEPQPEGPEVVIAMAGLGDNWLAMRAAVERRTQNDDLVLSGICRSSGEYLFVRPDKPTAP
jgi:hypothetical protein